MADDEELRNVLLAVRLRSVASTGAIAERTGLDPSVVAAVLAGATSGGWVRELTGRLAGWSLTAAGRDEVERLLAAEVDDRGVRREVELAYDRFLGVNPGFLRLCTRWQLVEVDGVEVMNDHADPVRDAALVAELGDLHAVAAAISDDLAGLLARFGGYRPRFEHAIGRLAVNDVDWFTKPLIDSYHTVWFELHEDLLATLGRDRSSEQATESTMEGRS